jgi:sterol desaturase/sphingolipid hydroxylase (fatty acid hydroxylase superfamily)
MDQFKDALLILISTPIYVVLIGLEIIVSNIRKQPAYTVKDTLTNVYLSAINGGIDLTFRVIYLAVLAWCYEAKVVEIEQVALYWGLLLLLEDFAFYWLHRIDHFVRVFWAVHITHHSSQHFNLSVGFRSSVFQPLYRFVYFIPIAMLGFRPEDIMFMYSATQIYGILIHTNHIGKLGWLEIIMATPSHHRVHHGANPLYLDKNMGMIFIFWDKFFGTFQQELEEEPVRYGLTTNLTSNHPVKVVFHEWQQIRNDFVQAPGWRDKWMYLFGPPGWSHDGSRQTSAQMREELAKNRD